MGGQERHDGCPGGAVASGFPCDEAILSRLGGGSPSQGSGIGAPCPGLLGRLEECARNKLERAIPRSGVRPCYAALARIQRRGPRAAWLESLIGAYGFDGCGHSVRHNETLLLLLPCIMGSWRLYCSWSVLAVRRSASCVGANRPGRGLIPSHPCLAERRVIGPRPGSGASIS